MKFRPLHDNVLVKRTEEEETSSGGIILSGSAKKNHHRVKLLHGTRKSIKFR